MPIGILFWVLMVLWALFGFGVIVLAGAPWGGNLLLFILLFLLGWRCFGFIVREGGPPPAP